MDECIDSLGQTKIFSTLDASSGYRKIDMDDTYMYGTSFLTQNGLYKYSRTPFCLKNAPETFQRALEVIFAKISGSSC